MIKSLYTTATGMRAQQTKVDVIANNVANVNTSGFKRSAATFEDLLYVTTKSPGLSDVGGVPTPVGLQIGSGAKLASTPRSHTAGNLEITERPLDIAINGKGMFRVVLQDGNFGYTRDGQFQINRDGTMVTNQGYIVDPQISMPADVLDISISPEGRVSGRTASSPNTTTEFGVLQLHRFPNEPGLLSAGGNIFIETEASGPPTVGNPGQQGVGLLQQGFVEGSNVQIVNELVSLIVAQRAYEVNSRAIQAADQMLSSATSIIR